MDHITVLFEPAAQFKKSTAQSTISSVSFDHHCIGYTADFLIYYVSPYSKLQAVAVSGNKTVNSQEIISDTKLSLGENVWGQYFHRSTYIDRLKKHSQESKQQIYISKG